MIVCVCEAVSDRTIRSLIRTGTRSVRDLGDRCGAGTDCRQCCRALRRLLHERHTKQDHRGR